MKGWTTVDMPRLDGKTVVVTGANSGLGYEGSLAFAEKGATVVMACRSVDRGERAADEIRRESAVGRDDLDLDVRKCDLASLESVREFADGLADDYDGIDVLCNNAGVMAIPRSETEDGFETQFGVNHLGHFALTGRLLPLLKAAEGIEGEARIVTQSSGAHEQGEMDFSDLNWERSYAKWKAYGRSKLANLLFAYELQRRINAAKKASDGEGGEGDEADEAPSIRSVACHPGWAATNLQVRTAEESGNPLMKVGMRAANAVLGQDAATGALPMLYAATADVDGGAYVEPGGLMNMRGTPVVGRSNDASYDRADARRLWEYSEEATGVEYSI